MATPAGIILGKLTRMGRQVNGLGSKFKVQGSKFKVQGSKFKVQGSKFKVQGSRFKVQGSRFKVQSSKFKVLGRARRLAPLKTFNYLGVSHRLVRDCLGKV
jgi:hypothetical protein